MHHKKGTKFLRFILLIWMILNLSILPFASAYSDDTPQISFTRKVSTSYLNGTFGKITAISSIKPSYSAQQSPKPSTYNLILFQDNQLSLQKTRNFILAQPNLFIMVTWSLFITLLACFIYFNHNKKSQLTIFFLLGIVLISVFFFMFYLKRSVTETKLKKEVKKMSSDTLETPAIKNYVQICLDDSVKEALILAGLQGGVVYSNYVNIFGLNIETGPSFDSSSDIGILGIPFVNYSVNYVPYLIYSIIRPRLDGSKYHPTVPGYPYEGNLRTLIEIDNFTVRNSLGNYLPSKPNKVSNLRALCSRQGSNYIDASVKFSCEEDLYNAASPHTVQTYLEEYIAQKVDNCIDFSSFIPETGFELEEGNISTEVLFGENNVYVTMEYPLKITVEGEAPVTKFLLYSTDLKIRFKKIYELAYHLIKEDVGNIFFDMETEGNTLNNCPNFNVSSSTRNVFTRPCMESGMNITKYEDEEVCHDCDNGGNYSDVYMITDNQSLIEGKPFVFLFAVENRRPALDFIDY
ncbi:MAG: LapA family protein, partial [Candidatus Woesearchaeota archaeon]|nr:LapA family protein [Candidatus Woesearchaeota archaeon]